MWAAQIWAVHACPNKLADLKLVLSEYFSFHVMQRIKRIEAATSSVVGWHFATVIHLRLVGQKPSILNCPLIAENVFDIELLSFGVQITY